MKFRLLSLGLLPITFLFAQSLSGQHTDWIKYHITGNVKVKDSPRIALVLDSRGITNRQVAIIKDNKFEFSGENPEIERAYLYYEDDILDDDGRLRFFGFYLAGEVSIYSESDSIRNFIVVNPDGNNREYYNYNLAFTKIADSIYKEPGFKNLTQNEKEEKMNYFTQRLITLNLPVNSIVRLAEMCQFYQYQDITDSMALAVLQPIKSELKNTMYYKRFLRDINGKKELTAGKPCIDFEVQDTSGNVYKISSLLVNSTYTVIDFYITWCGPCRGLARDLTQYYDLYHNKGFEVIAISCDDLPDSWKNYVRESKPKWNPYWIDKSVDAYRSYVHVGYPTTYLLDKNGIILSDSRTDIRKAIEDAFKVE